LYNSVVEAHNRKSQWTI